MIDMILHCPDCGKQHIDAPTKIWPNPPHRSHMCQFCGLVWRPADTETNGVERIKTHGAFDTRLFDAS
jgi:rubredoxin